MEVKPAEFARICGVSPSVISRRIKHNSLARNVAGLLDTDNPVNARYMARRRLKQSKEALADYDAYAAEQSVNTISAEIFDEFSVERATGLPTKLLGMSIRDLVARFKGIEGLERYIKMLRDLTAAEEKDQRTRERRLQLVEKDFVTARVFRYLDELMRQVLEYPESAVDELISLALSSGASARQGIVLRMENGLSKIIRDAKGQVAKEFSGLKAKYQNADTGLDERIEEIKERLAEDGDD
ncbi:MAG: hypothetical protein LBE74_06850 [Treponema sp.]|jgi:hypothetical protein|nr:hypothetical protein [Treponema sp.]